MRGKRRLLPTDLVSRRRYTRTVLLLPLNSSSNRIEVAQQQRREKGTMPRRMATILLGSNVTKLARLPTISGGWKTLRDGALRRQTAHTYVCAARRIEVRSSEGAEWKQLRCHVKVRHLKQNKRTRRKPERGGRLQLLALLVGLRTRRSPGLRVDLCCCETLRKK